ncbi:MAG TPA: 3-oxoacyl-ACP reductase family protein [Kouleothrix sp.]|jgi:acetoacetyl-CoA reductase/3-oxoacyl-[acyl-carrier protein] reductase|nr:3-oxoacyl-ACP reductase family protein [Kouleothrix sp.]
MGRLDGKVALVTGASRGIGREIAIELAAEGAKVALNYQSSDERAQEVADEIAKFGGTCLLAKADVAHPEEARAMVKRVVDHFGRLDVLVNNAGITRDKSIRKMTDDDWLEVVQTNLNAVFFCTSAAIPVMVEQNYGRIINVSSMNGQTSAFGQANYGASKGGIIAFTKTAAIELARFNITVNAICPGFTMTDMLSKVPANIQDQIRSKIPLGRFATPADIAKAATFLVDGGDYITGQQININGGAYM